MEIIKVGFLGPIGTYTDKAAQLYFKNKKKEIVDYNSIEDIFASVAKKKISAGVVPLENLVQGPVTETLDYLFDYGGQVFIKDSIITPITHCIGALKNRKKIKSILSKDQALRQCSNYISKRYPQAELIETQSTAAAVDKVLNENLTDSAVIADKEKIISSGLEAIAEDIGNVQNNKTKFAILGANLREKTGKDTSSLVIYPHRDRIGLLDDILQVISREYKINLSSIHSRPDSKGGFRFYMEIEGHVEDEKVNNCLKILKKKIRGNDVEIKVLGSYPSRPFREQAIKTIGIIGGTGRMGKWFKEFFENAGYNIIIAGRKTPLSYEECAKKSDAVIINVPIHATEKVIKKVAKHLKRGQLLLDNTSVKTGSIEKMLENTSEDVEVLGMHTIFGPNIKELRNQNIAFIYTPKSKNLALEFENIFYKYGASIVRTTAEEHDASMAFHQNLQHISNIIFADIARKHKFNPQMLGSFSSPNSRPAVTTMGRVLGTNEDLLAEIQKYNPKGIKMLEEFSSYLIGYISEFKQGNFKKVKENIKMNKNFLGEDFTNKAREKSEKMQESMLEEN